MLKCFEIYTGQFFDLLRDYRRPLKYHTKNSSICVEGLEAKELVDQKEFPSLLKQILKNRVSHSNLLNNRSSRSHAIFEICCRLSVEYENQKSRAFTSKLTIVDLAGSERNKRTLSTAKNMKEANSVNLSLSFLRKCFDAVRNGKRVPYRESKLTHYLKDYFRFPEDLLMILNISASQADFNETLKALKYANKAKSMQHTSKVNSFWQKSSKSCRISGNSFKFEFSESNNCSEMFQSCLDQETIYNMKHLTNLDFFHVVVAEVKSKVQLDYLEYLKGEIRRSCASHAQQQAKFYETQAHQYLGSSLVQHKHSQYVLGRRRAVPVEIKQANRKLRVLDSQFNRIQNSIFAQLELDHAILESNSLQLTRNQHIFEVLYLPPLFLAKYNSTRWGDHPISFGPKV